MNNKLLGAVLVACFALIGALFFYYNEYKIELETQNIKKFLDFQTEILNKNIEEEKLSAMTVAVLLSENENIHRCFFENNRTKCMDTLGKFAATLNKVSIYKNVKFHLHTPDMKSFARSWMPMYNDSLSSFRHMLKEAKKGVVSGIEVGRGGVFIRSVAPVMSDGVNLGSIEVLLDFEHLSGFFAKQGVDLFVLLDKTPVSPYDNETDEQVIDGFYLINKQTGNLNVLPILKDINFKVGEFYKFDTHNFTLQPMNDVKGNRVGYFVIYFNTDFQERNLSKLDVWFR